MLYTLKTKSNQKWKFILILPILILFIYSFNRVEINTYKKTTLNPIDIHFTIIKESTDADLKAIKELFKSQDVNFEVSQLKRNEKSEIISINIHVNSKEFKTNFVSESSQPIEPIFIKFDITSKKISIGNMNKTIQKDKMLFFKENIVGDSMPHIINYEGNDDERVIIINNNDGPIQSEKNIQIIRLDKMDSIGKKEIKLDWTEEKNLKTSGEKKYIIVVEGDENGISTYKVNGKEVNKEELEKIDTDSIKEVNVIKKKVIIEKKTN